MDARRIQAGPQRVSTQDKPILLIQGRGLGGSRKPSSSEYSLAGISASAYLVRWPSAKKAAHFFPREQPHHDTAVCVLAIRQIFQATLANGRRKGGFCALIAIW